MSTVPPTRASAIDPGDVPDGSTELPATTWADTARTALQIRLAELDRERKLVESESRSGGSCGDAADRSAHVEAVIRLEELELRITDLQWRLQTLEQFDHQGARRGEGLQLGGTVTVRFDTDEECETFVVGPAEQFGAGSPVITPDSPLGSALRGARPGDYITYRNGIGRQAALTVVSIG